jgi:hypothetical protein
LYWYFAHLIGKYPADLIDDLLLCLIMQFCLALGLAGLFWPERLMPVFETLMFPWPASDRGIRANSLVALAFWLVLIPKLLGRIL